VEFIGWLVGSLSGLFICGCVFGLLNGLFMCSFVDGWLVCLLIGVLVVWFFLIGLFLDCSLFGLLFCFWLVGCLVC
jgi:hypothetical protein